MHDATLPHGFIKTNYADDTGPGKKAAAAFLRRTGAGSSRRGSKPAARAESAPRHTASSRRRNLRGRPRRTKNGRTPPGARPLVTIGQPAANAAAAYIVT
ncbi:hypothetical protein [Burkholderia thailandensis]|uniref:hypothetical protein n=1 Tax=Burkholderia thailandensis TaxID=57975 RepID=UPI0005F26175|nr:hypothetical protein [Burkholderia thailandensis]KXF59386.1 hypothetical protein AQ476_19335 [Burkholderia thailandensis]MCZ2893360.1 hypothetical protein [Burkholderia thailandensis]PNE78272.1 hypothetical protein A8H37_08720 [Burkholderia thailandensis]TGB31818.1 hypothetical protein C6946_20985 [Burkholderia thailandensis]